MDGYPHFSFWIPITLAKIYFFPIVKIFAEIHLYQEAPSLRGRSAKTKRLGGIRGAFTLSSKVDRKHPAVLVNDAALVLPHTFCTSHFNKFHRIFTLVSFGKTIITTLQLICNSIPEKGDPSFTINKCC